MYLSTINYMDILFKLDNNEIEKMVFCNDVKTKSADIGIVLGGTSMIPYRLDKIIKLYKKKKVRKILVSGGVGYFNLKRTMTEAELMKNYLIQHGVLVEDILVEDKSRNTYENFLYCYELLKNEFDLEKTSFILITSDFHMRRAIMLFEFFFNSYQLGAYGVCDGKTDRYSWKKGFYGRRVVKQEALLLKHYAKSLKIDNIKIKWKMNLIYSDSSYNLYHLYIKLI